MVARSGDTPAELAKAPYTGTYLTSPADLLKAPGPLLPNPANYIEVQFILKTTNDMSPKLKGFAIAFACEDTGPN